mgnify:CR=1 FL=1
MISRNQAVQQVLEIFDKLDLADRLLEKATSNVPGEAKPLNAIERHALELGKKECFKEWFMPWRFKDIGHRENDLGLIVFESRTDWIASSLNKSKLPSMLSVDEVSRFFEKELDEAYRLAKLQHATEENWAPEDVSAV